jgi:hypothetical protein
LGFHAKPASGTDEVCGHARLEQGAEAAVHAGDALAGISGQLAALAARVAALPGTGLEQRVR